MAKGQLLYACIDCGRITRTRRCPQHQHAHNQRRQRRAMTPSGHNNAHRAFRRIAAQVLNEEPYCWICGRPAQPNDPLTIDHLTPVSRGGTNQRDNLRAAHHSCNSRRGNRYPPFVPDTPRTYPTSQRYPRGGGL